MIVMRPFGQISRSIRIVNPAPAIRKAIPATPTISAALRTAIPTIAAAPTVKTKKYCWRSASGITYCRTVS